MLYHVHMHCIISGGGLTQDHKIRKTKKSFFLPVKVLRNKFKGKFLAALDALYQSASLEFSASCEELRSSYEWAAFRNSLYEKDVLPPGFQKIRYYGFLNNRYKSRNLKLIFKIQGGQRFKERYAGLSIGDLLAVVWKIDIRICPECGCHRMQQAGRTYGSS